MISSWRRWASSSTDSTASVSMQSNGRKRLLRLFLSVRTTCTGTPISGHLSSADGGRGEFLRHGPISVLNLKKNTSTDHRKRTSSSTTNGLRESRNKSCRSLTRRRRPCWGRAVRWGGPATRAAPARVRRSAWRRWTARAASCRPGCRWTRGPSRRRRRRSAGSPDSILRPHKTAGLHFWGFPRVSFRSHPLRTSALEEMLSTFTYRQIWTRTAWRDRRACAGTSGTGAPTYSTCRNPKKYSKNESSKRRENGFEFR